MKPTLIIPALLLLLFFNCKNQHEKVAEMDTKSAEEMHETISTDAVGIIPINHASLILTYKDVIIYVDPVGGADAYSQQERPDYVLITDIHGDHFDPSILQTLISDSTILIVPGAIKEKLPELEAKEVIVMNNGDTKDLDMLSLEAIPMYNLRKEALKYHEKGRGNGYVLTLGNERIYISGDTEDIPEMRQLSDIDVAFVCMNLPYTMTIESAASAVLDFKPNKVYPYHYRGTNGMSDVAKFKELVNEKNPEIEVVQLDWYR